MLDFLQHEFLRITGRNTQMLKLQFNQSRKTVSKLDPRVLIRSKEGTHQSSSDLCGIWLHTWRNLWWSPDGVHPVLWRASTETETGWQIGWILPFAVVHQSREVPSLGDHVPWQNLCTKRLLGQCSYGEEYAWVSAAVETSHHWPCGEC